MKVDRFEDLECWRLARRLTNQVYNMWEPLPRFTDVVLRGQMTAASGSCMHNIAE
jgi:four helix bundle protein